MNQIKKRNKYNIHIAHHTDPCPEMFRCENDPCIPMELRCNGRYDCPFDTSDELDCPEPERKFIDTRNN